MTPEPIDPAKAKHLASRLKAWRKYVQTSELKRIVDEAASMLEAVAQAAEETTSE